MLALHSNSNNPMYIAPFAEIQRLRTNAFDLVLKAAIITKSNGSWFTYITYSRTVLSTIAFIV